MTSPSMARLIWSSSAWRTEATFYQMKSSKVFGPAFCSSYSRTAIFSLILSDSYDQLCPPRGFGTADAPVLAHLVSTGNTAISWRKLGLHPRCSELYAQELRANFFSFILQELRLGWICCVKQSSAGKYSWQVAFLTRLVTRFRKFLMWMSTVEGKSILYEKPYVPSNPTIKRKKFLIWFFYYKIN